MVSLQRSSDGTLSPPADGALATFLADGNGHVSYVQTDNTGGTISTSSGPATYSVNTDGTVAINGGDANVGAIGSDGSVLIFTDMTPGRNPTINIAIRQ